MKRKIAFFSILAAAVLAFTVFPATALGVDTTVLVNGVDIVAAEGNTVQCGDGTAVYDAESNTLTLNNATINTHGLISDAGTAGIVTNGDLNIVLIGKNVVDLSATRPTARGIWVNEGLTIEGTEDASLEMSGAITCFNSGDISIKNASIIISCEANTASAVWARNGSINIENSNVEASASYGGLAAEYDVTITNSTLNISSTVNGYSAVSTYSGTLTIQDCPEVIASSQSSAIYGTDALNINNSVIEATSVNSAALSSANALTIENNSDVTAIGNTSGITSGSNLTINGSKVEATGTNNAGIASNHAVIIAGNAEIVSNGVSEVTGVSVVPSVAEGALIEIKVGTSAEDAVHVEGSPFDAETDLSSIDFSQYTYFQVKEHVHAGGTATCASGAICTDCGKAYGEKDAENHVGETEVRNDKEATCTEDGYTGDTCCVGCGAVLEEGTSITALGHDWSEPVWNWAEDGSSATAVFTCQRDENHTEEVTAEISGQVTEPSCEEGGETVFTATVTLNDVTYTDTKTMASDATGHAPGTEWVSNESEHWNVCTKCEEKLNTAPHDFEWIIDKEATETEAGSKHEECKVCGYEKAAVEIPATGTTVPETGDDSNLILWIVLLVIASAGFAAVTTVSKKKKYNK